MAPPAGSLRRNAFQQRHVCQPQHRLAADGLRDDVQRDEGKNNEQEQEVPTVFEARRGYGPTEWQCRPKVFTCEGRRESGVPRSSACVRRVESAAEGESNHRQYLWISCDVDLTFTLAVRTNQSSQLELGEVMTHRRYALSRLFRQRPDIQITIGEQPENVQPNCRRQQAEQRGGVL